MSITLTSENEAYSCVGLTILRAARGTTECEYLSCWKMKGDYCHVLSCCHFHFNNIKIKSKSLRTAKSKCSPVARQQGAVSPTGKPHAPEQLKHAKL